MSGLLAGFLGGAAQGVADASQNSINMRSKVDLENEMSQIQLQRKQAEMEMVQRYRVADEQRQRSMAEEDRKNPENPAYYDMESKKAAHKGLLSSQAVTDLIGTGEGKLPNGDTIITTEDGQIARLNKAGEAVQMWDSKEAFQKDQLDIGSKANLANVESQSKLREAQISETKAKTGLYASGGMRGGLASQKFDAAQIKDARNSYKAAFETTDDLGQKVHDTDGQLAFNKSFDAMIQRGRDPQSAADGAMEIVQAIRSKAQKDGVPFAKAFDAYQAAMASAGNQQANKVEKPAEQKQAEKKAVASGGTSGSHSKQEDKMAIGGEEDKAIRAKIMEKRKRLDLKGISDEAKLQLNIEIRELENKLSNKNRSRPSFMGS